MFKDALFKIAKHWKQVRKSSTEWTNCGLFITGTTTQ